MASAWLSSTSSAYPSLAPALSTLEALHAARLYHQLTLAVEGLLSDPAFQKHGDVLLALYSQFMAEFLDKLAPLKIAQIASVISQQIQEPKVAINFLQGVVTKLQERKDETATAAQTHSILYVKMQQASLYLRAGDERKCKELVEAGVAELANLEDVDASVHAAVHYANSLYHKVRQNFAEFYSSCMSYISYITTDALPDDSCLGLAVDLSLAALLGDGVYGIAELINHPVLRYLKGTPSAWLVEMVQVFQEGDLHAYDKLCATHAAALNGQPLLVAHAAKLREKITIMCLMSLLFSLPAEERCVSLSLIAERTKLDIAGVERLLMKALSAKLIKGSIDQVAGTVTVTWVQPRALTQSQARALRDRLDQWIGKLEGTLNAIPEARAQDVLLGV